MECIDLCPGGDASGSRQSARGRGPHRQDRVDARAGHQPFGVDVRVQELVAVRLERLDRLDGGQRQRGLPAVNDDVAATAVYGAYHLVPADGVAQRCGELEIGSAALEQ